MRENHPINKLPKWAQQIIERLERKVNELKRELDVRTKQQPVSHIEIDPTWQTEYPHYIRDEARIRFTLSADGHDYVEVSLQKDEHGPVVYLYGSRCIQLMPRSGNTAYLRVEER